MTPNNPTTSATDAFGAGAARLAAPTWLLQIGHSVPVSREGVGHVRCGRAELFRERRRLNGMRDGRATAVLALVLLAACSGGDDADVATSTSNPNGPISVEVTLYHCGLEIWFDGRTWEVPGFDETSAPEEFVGRGTIEPFGGESLRYVDESGIALFFVPVDVVGRIGCA